MSVSTTVAAVDRDRRGRRRGALALAAARLRLARRCAASARRSSCCSAGGRADLVDFAVSLQARIDDLHRAVDEIAAGLARVDRRVDERSRTTAIVRYDAYEDTGGHQSASVALLDSLAERRRPHRDPGPRLRAHLHEGARPRQGVGRALARGAGGGRARDGRGEQPAPAWYYFARLQQVLVLNASYEPLNVCSVRRAHVLVFKGKAEVLEELDQPLRSATRHVSPGRT